MDGDGVRPAVVIQPVRSFTWFRAGSTFITRREPVALHGFRNAAATLRGGAVRTPLLPSEALEARFGVPVFLKPEMLQRGGAFKFRGAYWFVSWLSAAQRAHGLVAP